MEKKLEGLEGVECQIDDVPVDGETQQIMMKGYKQF